MKKLLVALLGLAAVAAVGAGFVYYSSQEEATVPIAEGYGPNPMLPEPNPTVFPTVNVAETNPFGDGELPSAAQGFAVNEYAKGLDHPRWLHVLPNGDVLVAESNKPPSPGEGFSLRGWVMGIMMDRAGANVPSANRISLLRDKDGDGVAETKTVLLKDLYSPFGMTLLNGKLYVANANAIVAFPYKDGDTEITAPAEKIVDLPAGLNHHWTKDVIASKDGSKLYVTVGSNSNVGENGMDIETDRAAPRNRRRDQEDAAVRVRTSQPEWIILAARQRSAMGCRERA